MSAVTDSIWTENDDPTLLLKRRKKDKGQETFDR